MNEVVVGIDIGSTKVCTILGQLNKNNQVQVLGVGTAQCKGLKKGLVVDIDSVSQSVKDSARQAERMSDMEIQAAFVNIPGGHATLVKNRGVIAVPGDDREITREDVARVLDEVKIAGIPIDREVIGVIPLQYIVDGNENIKDPVGMIGVRLEVDAYIITAATASIQSFIKCIERCSIDVLGTIISPLASAEVTLTKDEKEVGTALVDIGGETSDISIFKDSTLVHTKLIPIGGMHITNDISIGLKIPVSEAEQLKRQYGYAAVSMLKSEEDIHIGAQGINQNLVIKSRELTDIIEARIQEIFYLINKELEASGYKERIPGGVVITGGGTAFIKGSTDMASSLLGLPVRIGAPQYIGVASPVYSAAAGIVKHILSHQKHNSSGTDENKKSNAKPIKRASKKEENMVDRIRSFFGDFF